MSVPASMASASMSAASGGPSGRLISRRGRGLHSRGHSHRSSPVNLPPFKARPRGFGRYGIIGGVARSDLTSSNLDEEKGKNDGADSSKSINQNSSEPSPADPAASSGDADDDAAAAASSSEKAARSMLTAPPTVGTAMSSASPASVKLAAARELARKLVEERAALRAVSTAEEMLRLARTLVEDGAEDDERVKKAEHALEKANNALANAAKATGAAAQEAAAANEAMRRRIDQANENEKELAESTSSSTTTPTTTTTTKSSKTKTKPAEKTKKDDDTTTTTDTTESSTTSKNGSRLIGGRTAEEWEIYALGLRAEKEKRQQQSQQEEDGQKMLPISSLLDEKVKERERIQQEMEEEEKKLQARATEEDDALDSSDDDQIKKKKTKKGKTKKKEKQKDEAKAAKEQEEAAAALAQAQKEAQEKEEQDRIRAEKEQEEERRIRAEKEAQEEQDRIRAVKEQQEERRIRAEKEEQDRIRAEKEQEEQDRIRAEKEAQEKEEARIRAEKEEEERRIRAEKEAEAKRIQEEAEAKIRAEKEREEEERRLREEAEAAEAEARRIQEELEARLREEEEARLREEAAAAEAEARRIQAELEARLREEEEARLREEEEARLLEARRIAQEEEERRQRELAEAAEAEAIRAAQAQEMSARMAAEEQAAEIAEQARARIIAAQREASVAAAEAAEAAAVAAKVTADSALKSEAMLAAEELALLDVDLIAMKEEAASAAIKARQQRVEEARARIQAASMLEDRFFTVPSNDKLVPGSIVSVFYRCGGGGASLKSPYDGVIMRCGFDDFRFGTSEIAMKPFDAKRAAATPPTETLGGGEVNPDEAGTQWFTATVRVPTSATSFACVFRDSAGVSWDNCYGDNFVSEIAVPSDIDTSIPLGDRRREASSTWWTAISEALLQSEMRAPAASAQARQPALRTAVERRARGSLDAARFEAAMRVADRATARETEEAKGALSYVPGVYAFYRPSGYWDEPSMQHEEGYAILVYNRDSCAKLASAPIEDDDVVACHAWYLGTGGVMMESSSKDGEYQKYHRRRENIMANSSEAVQRAMGNFWGDALAITSDDALKDTGTADPRWGAAFAGGATTLDEPSDCVSLEAAEHVTYHMRPIAASAASVTPPAGPAVTMSPYESVSKTTRDGGGIGAVARGVQPGVRATCPRVPFALQLPSSNDDLPSWAFSDPTQRSGRWYAAVVYLPRRTRTTMGFVFSDVRNKIWDNNSKRDYLSPVRFHESGDWTDPREAAPHPGPSSLSTPALARQLALVADEDWAEVASHAVSSAGALAGARVAERVSALHSSRQAHLSVAALLPAGSSLALGRTGKLLYKSVDGPLYGHCFTGRSIYAALTYNRGTPAAEAMAMAAGLPRVVRMVPVSSSDPTWSTLAAKSSKGGTGAAITDDVGSAFAAAFEADIPPLPDWVQRVDASFAMDPASAVETVHGSDAVEAAIDLMKADEAAARAAAHTAALTSTDVPNAAGVRADEPFSDDDANSAKYRSQDPRLVDDNGGLMYCVHVTQDCAVRDVRSLNVVHITAECAPIAKVGGLGDVVYGLGCESARAGHRVSICLPHYDVGRYDAVRFVTGDDGSRAWDTFSFDNQNWSVCKGQLEVGTDGAWWFDGSTIPVYFFRNDSTGAFEQGCVYGRGNSDTETFRSFSRASVYYTCSHQGALWTSSADYYDAGTSVDVVHAHDWTTSFACEMASQLGSHLPSDGSLTRPTSVLTVHNMHHGAEHLMFHSRFCSALTTVSPTYAREIINDGRFFDPLPSPQGTEPSAIVDKLYGVVNGIEISSFDPRNDVALGPRFVYDGESVAKGKRACKVRWFLESCARSNSDARPAQLRQLVDSGKPLVGFVGRLANQKGLPLVRHAAEVCCRSGVPFFILGSPSDGGIGNDFNRLRDELQRRYPEQVVSINLQFDEAFGRWCYAACDIMLVPSMFEPCGLTQLVAMRYGALPLVRSTGGLADTVVDLETLERPPKYIFNNFGKRVLDTSEESKQFKPAAMTSFVAGERHDAEAKRQAGEDFEAALLRLSFARRDEVNPSPRNRRISSTHPPPFHSIRASGAGKDPKGCAGFSFEKAEPNALEETLLRAIDVYENRPDAWSARVKRNMMQDWSWASSSIDYHEIYHTAVRRGYT
ncbi:soluble starch synthase [Pycnococcus provasolii]